MHWIKSICFGLILAYSTSSSVAHAVAGESIKSFDSQISVEPDGTVRVLESIYYDFGAGQRHGIFRYIPYRYTDDQGRRLETTVRLLTTTQNGSNVATEQSRESGNHIIKIGDASKKVTGLHRYSISYEINPLVTSLPDGDLLRFNVTGNGWDVPIEQVSATVTSPKVLPFQATCYTGVQGSTDKNCLISQSPDGYKISAHSLLPGQGLTIDLIWPANSFATYLRPGRLNLSFWQLITIITSFIGLALLIVAAIRWLHQKLVSRQRKQDQTVIARYESPDGLKPAELGFISDDTINLIEVTATLVDLAVRGYIKITQTSPRRWAGLKPAQYSFTRLKEPDGLENFETSLFNALFTSGTEVALANLNKTAMASAVKAVNTEVEERLKTKGYYRVPLTKSSRSLIGVITFFALTFILNFSGFALIGPVSIAGGLLANYLVSKNRTSTPLGVEQWAKVEGFKLFLKVTETDRLKFTDAPAKTPELFSQLLPAAIALKVEKDWAKQFKGIDVLPSSGGWYSAANTSHFSAGFLAGDLSGSFASSVATNFAPANTSSSGFGGGFSGGGGSGGGGGSW